MRYDENERGRYRCPQCGDQTITRREAELGCCDRCYVPLREDDPEVVRAKAIRDRANATLDALIARYREAL